MIPRSSYLKQMKIRLSLCRDHDPKKPGIKKEKTTSRLLRTQVTLHILTEGLRREQTWWTTPITDPSSGKGSQEDSQESEANLRYRIVWDTVSRKTKQELGSGGARL